MDSGLGGRNDKEEGRSGFRNNCHPELVSGSVSQPILNQVQNDRGGKQEQHGFIYAYSLLLTACFLFPSSASSPGLLHTTYAVNSKELFNKFLSH
jgi:hypothetical protein